jgi:hypothetical protein
MAPNLATAFGILLVVGFHFDCATIREQPEIMGGLLM